MIFSRPLNALAAFVQACFPRIDYQALYPGTVVRQNGSNSFDVQPDSKKLPGLNNRPIESGVPGMVLTLSMSPPPRVLIGFRNADPSLPFILLWESGAVVTELDLSAAL